MRCLQRPHQEVWACWHGERPLPHASPRGGNCTACHLEQAHAAGRPACFVVCRGAGCGGLPACESVPGARSGAAKAAGRGPHDAGGHWGPGAQEGAAGPERGLPAGAQGAFSIAAKAGVPVVPVTLVGTGRLMPNGQEARLFGGRARVIVHPAIQPSKDAGAMAAAARDAIASALPPDQR